MISIAHILVLLLVVGFAVMFTKFGRLLFDVAVFLTLLVMLLGLGA